LPYLFLEIIGKEFAAEESLHSREVDIKLIDGSFLKQRHRITNHFRYQSRDLAVRLIISLYHNRLAAQSQCRLHGHGAVNAKLTSLIAACRHHAALAVAANQHRLSNKFRIAKLLHRNKEAIQVHMNDMTIIS